MFDGTCIQHFVPSNKASNFELLTNNVNTTNDVPKYMHQLSQRSCDNWEGTAFSICSV